VVGELDLHPTVGGEERRLIGVGRRVKSSSRSPPRLLPSSERVRRLLGETLRAPAEAGTADHTAGWVRAPTAGRERQEPRWASARPATSQLPLATSRRLRQMQARCGASTTRRFPCGGCTACCTASQFIPIEADEVATLARIPQELRFPAPRRPPGHVLLGYDERALPDARRRGVLHLRGPAAACRTYDCRVLPAGVAT
jgi:hypothetical protein